MASTLPPDPYKALGVLKDAKLPEIRSAHRKLVLKCHPDKVQDAALKAVKQDEFQKVQQAYELLSDDTRRSQYDDQVKLFELRKEMGKGVPTARSNPFEYEVRNAEPRASTSRSKPSATYPTPPTSAKVYERHSPNLYEDFHEEAKRPSARASKSQEYERTRTSSREEERERIRRERKDAEERDRERERERERDRERERERERERDRERERMKEKTRYEKELKKAEKEKKKSKEREKERDKDRKRSSDEKHSARVTAAIAVDESSDDAYYAAARPRSTDKKSKQRMEEETRIRHEETLRAEKARRDEVTIRTRKMNDAKDFAAQYMQAAKQKIKPVEEEYVRTPLSRAQTFAASSPTYNVRYPSPSAQYSDEETPRRSSARSSSRKPEPTSTSRSRETKSSKESRRPSTARDAYIVEPPSPPPVKVPSLQAHVSAPPVISSSRKEPTRSKTMQPQFTREKAAAPPPLPRASTFAAGDRGRGSNLRQAHNISSDESDSDSPVGYTSKVRSSSPVRHRHAPEPTRYIIDNGRSVPVGSSPRTHRSELREEIYDTRDRSESPRGGRHASTEHTRPPLTRSGGSGSRQAPRSSSHSQAYYPPDPPKPSIIPERPKMPGRESQGLYRGGSAKVSASIFPDVKYQQAYGPEHVVYTPHVPDQYRRGSDPTHRGYDSYPVVRGERVGLYA